MLLREKRPKSAQIEPFDAPSPFLMMNAFRREADGLSKVLKHVDPHTPLEQIHDGTFDSFRAAQRNAGLAAGTINRDLAPVRRMLRLAASVWRDETGPWLTAMAIIRTVKGEKRKPYPLT